MRWFDEEVFIGTFCEATFKLSNQLVTDDPRQLHTHNWTDFPSASPFLTLEKDIQPQCF
jgi:hypothetical protein